MIRRSYHQFTKAIRTTKFLAGFGGAVLFMVLGLMFIHAKAAQAATVTCSISAASTTINSGSSTTITWSSNNGTIVSVSGPGISSSEKNGSKSTGALTSTATYTIIVDLNSACKKTVTVTVRPNVTCSISADNTRIDYGASTKIKWSSSGGTVVSVSGPGVASSSANNASGQSTGALYATATYTITVNWDSACVQSVTVYVNEAPPAGNNSCGIGVYLQWDGTYKATWNSNTTNWTGEGRSKLFMKSTGDADFHEIFSGLSLNNSAGLTVPTPPAGKYTIYEFRAFNSSGAQYLFCNDGIDRRDGTTEPPTGQNTCTLNVTGSGSSFTASWTVSADVRQNYPTYKAFLYRDPNNPTMNLPLEGSVGISPPSGTTTYTIVIYNPSSPNNPATWLTSCTKDVTNGPGSTAQNTCNLNVTSAAGVFTASWTVSADVRQNYPTYKAFLYRDPNNPTMNLPLEGSHAISPPLGNSTYNIVIYNPASPNNAATWITSCSKDVVNNGTTSFRFIQNGAGIPFSHASGADCEGGTTNRLLHSRDYWLTDNNGSRGPITIPNGVDTLGLNVNGAGDVCEGAGYTNVNSQHGGVNNQTINNDAIYILSANITSSIPIPGLAIDNIVGKSITLDRGPQYAAHPGLAFTAIQKFPFTIRGLNNIDPTKSYTITINTTAMQTAVASGRGLVCTSPALQPTSNLTGPGCNSSSQSFSIVINGSGEPNPAQPSCSISPAQITLAPGGSATLRWTSSNATRAVLKNITAGSQQQVQLTSPQEGYTVSPDADTVYELVVTDAVGQTGSCRSVIVMQQDNLDCQVLNPVVGQPNQSVTKTIYLGQSTLLKWKVGNPSSGYSAYSEDGTVLGNAIGVNAAGATVKPTKTTKYYLAKTKNGGGQRSCEITIFVEKPANRPYIKVDGSDVLSGASFGSRDCQPSVAAQSARIATNGFLDNKAIWGYSSSQYAAFASGRIGGIDPNLFLGNNGFLRGNYKDLLLANTGSNSGAREAGDYYGSAAEALPCVDPGLEELKTKAGTILNSPTQPQVQAAFASGEDTILIKGSVTINTTTVTNDKTIIIEGDAVINGDIAYQYPATIDQLPHLKLIANNMYVNPSANERRIDGEYIAYPDETGNQGVFDTCSVGGNGVWAGGLVINSCKRRLIVNGSVIARRILWKGTRGTVGITQSVVDASCLHGSEAVGAGSSGEPAKCAAEYINFDPENYLARFKETSAEIIGFPVTTVELPPVY